MDSMLSMSSLRKLSESGAKNLNSGRLGAGARGGGRMNLGEQRKKSNFSNKNDGNDIFRLTVQRMDSLKEP
jgi:hypothetical protein